MSSRDVEPAEGLAETPQAAVETLMRLAQYREQMLPLGPDNTTDQRVRWMLEAARSLMGLRGIRLDTDEPDWQAVENVRKPARQFAKMLLASAPWLGDEVKAELRAFLGEYPPAVFSGRYVFTSDWFSHKCEASWSAHFAGLAGQPHLQVLEIGSYEGRATVWLLTNVLTHPTSRIVCIDPFHPAYGARFDRNMESTGAAQKVTKLCARSTAALPHLPPASFDFIYVDGDHKKEYVLQDAVLVWPLLKVGGSLTFDDYHFEDVRVAVAAFRAVYQEHLHVVSQGAQLTVRKTGEPRPDDPTVYTEE